MTDCIFCKIIKKEIPSDIVYEDEHTVAFLDNYPQVKGHTLVVPKKHCRNWLDCDDADLKTHAVAVKKVSLAVKKATGAGGLNVATNIEPAANQLVFHMHTHILPRFEKDAFVITYNTKKTPISKEETQQITEKIKHSF